MAWETLLPVVQDLGTLVRMGGLEGSQHEEKGEMTEAWTWYHAMLRSSRHVGMNGVLIERMMGAYHHRLAVRRIRHWAADPRVDAKLLRQALEDVVAADAMTPPLSRAMKLDYVVARALPPGEGHIAGESRRSSGRFPEEASRGDHGRTRDTGLPDREKIATLLFV
jgi:hypothetical protein